MISASLFWSYYVNKFSHNCYINLNFYFSFSPLSSKLWGRRTNRRCCSVSSWWRIKACTVELPTWTSFATFTGKSGSCSLNLRSSASVPAPPSRPPSPPPDWPGRNTALKWTMLKSHRVSLTRLHLILLIFWLCVGRTVHRQELKSLHKERRGNKKPMESLLRFSLKSPKLPFQHAFATS